jgi:hypothetical protein
MAKTNFAHGTIVEAAFLNTLYQTGGGHVHDGGSEDGHAGKIDLERDVEGVLPAGNVDLSAFANDFNTRMKWVAEFEVYIRPGGGITVPSPLPKAQFYTLTPDWKMRLVTVIMPPVKSFVENATLYNYFPNGIPYDEDTLDIWPKDDTMVVPVYANDSFLPLKVSTVGGGLYMQSVEVPEDDKWFASGFVFQYRASY